MKKMLNKTIIKTVAVLLVIGGLIYALYWYFIKGSATNPLTGNSSNERISELKVADSFNQLNYFRDEKVDIEFSEDVDFIDKSGKSHKILKGKLLQGTISIIVPTGGRPTIYDYDYFIKPLTDVYGEVEKFKIDPKKVAAVLDHQFFTERKDIFQNQI